MWRYLTFFFTFQNNSQIHRSFSSPVFEEKWNSTLSSSGLDITQGSVASMWFWTHSTMTRVWVCVCTFVKSQTHQSPFKPKLLIVFLRAMMFWSVCRQDKLAIMYGIQYIHPEPIRLIWVEKGVSHLRVSMVNLSETCSWSLLFQIVN